MRRIWIASIDPEALDPAPDEARHLRDVLRARAGDEVVVFDGAGRERTARVEASTRRGVRLVAAGPIRVSPPAAGADVVLLLSVLKGEAMDRVIRGVTELGVREVRPVVAARSVPEIRAERAGRQAERWRRIAREALRQCGRTWLPAIAEAAPLADALAHPPAGRRLLLDESERTIGLADVVPGVSAFAIAVGPEGGWEDGERARFAGAGFEPVGLSDAILRAETAALAAVAVLRTASFKGSRGAA